MSHKIYLICHVIFLKQLLENKKIGTSVFYVLSLYRPLIELQRQTVLRLISYNVGNKIFTLKHNIVQTRLQLRIKSVQRTVTDSLL